MMKVISFYSFSYILLGEIMNILKYVKVLLYILIPLLVLSIIMTLFQHFNILGESGTNYFKLIAIALSMLIGGIYIGTKATKKGWLEGIKVGLEVIIILFIVSYLAFDKGISIKTLIYYIIIVSSAMLGSMIGINKRKSN